MNNMTEAEIIAFLRALHGAGSQEPSMQAQPYRGNPMDQLQQMPLDPQNPPARVYGGPTPPRPQQPMMRPNFQQPGAARLSGGLGSLLSK